MPRRPSHTLHARTDMRHILLDRARVADEREYAAVGRPRRDVESALAAVHIGDHAWRAAAYRKQAQIDVLIFGRSFSLLFADYLTKIGCRQRPYPRCGRNVPIVSTKIGDGSIRRHTSRPRTGPASEST
jgi:hypothetical protein